MPDQIVRIIPVAPHVKNIEEIDKAESADGNAMSSSPSTTFRGQERASKRDVPLGQVAKCLGKGKDKVGSTLSGGAIPFRMGAIEHFTHAMFQRLHIGEQARIPEPNVSKLHPCAMAYQPLVEREAYRPDPIIQEYCTEFIHGPADAFDVPQQGTTYFDKQGEPYYITKTMIPQHQIGGFEPYYEVPYQQWTPAFEPYVHGGEPYANAPEPFMGTFQPRELIREYPHTYMISGENSITGRQYMGEPVYAADPRHLQFYTPSIAVEGKKGKKNKYSKGSKRAFKGGKSKSKSGGGGFWDHPKGTNGNLAW